MESNPKIAFFGDIVGRPGRYLLRDYLSQWRQENGWDLVIANGENAAAGSGLTAKLALEIQSYGVDAITLGDHVWDQKKFPNEINDLEFVCRPGNLPQECPGRRYLLLETSMGKIAVFTVLGRQYVNLRAECPFLTANAILEELKDKAEAFLVEIHAEVTSEKIALGWYLDGRVALVAGTHTHVPTADARFLEKGTAYITDLGMTGPYRSVLGREVDAVVGKFTDGMPRRFEVASGDPRLCGVEIELDSRGFAQSIKRLELTPPSP